MSKNGGVRVSEGAITLECWSLSNYGEIYVIGIGGSSTCLLLNKLMLV